MGRVSFNDLVEEHTIDEIDEQEPVSLYDYQNVPENKSWAGALPMKQGLYDPGKYPRRRAALEAMSSAVEQC